MTRHKALTRAAELIRLHMATPDETALAALAQVEREIDDMARDYTRMAGDLRAIRDAMGLADDFPLGALPRYVADVADVADVVRKAWEAPARESRR